MKVKSLSHVLLLVALWTAAHQAPRGIFQARVYWNGVPLPSPKRGWGVKERPESDCYMVLT